MKKIPTIFLRDEQDRKHVTNQINPECQWVFDGKGIATIKYDGTWVVPPTFCISPAVQM